jgi:hypothetical protein
MFNMLAACGNVSASLTNTYSGNWDGSDYMTRTPGAAGDRRKFTLSFWLKRASTSGDQQLLRAYHSYAGCYFYFGGSDNKLRFLNATANPATANVRSTTAITDTSSWHHIVLAADTTIASDPSSVLRLRLYIDGVEDTWEAKTYWPAQDLQMEFNNTTAHYLGAWDASNDRFNGLIDEVAFVDGQQLDPTSFASGGKPIDLSGLTFGTQGGWYRMENSGAMGTDSSGNSNTYTNSGVAQSSTVP